jgi:hypothetical protein
MVAYEMTKKEIVTKLTMLKLMFGVERIPVISDIPICKENKELLEAIAELANKKYLVYEFDYVEDDEGIRHKFTQRGFVLSPKAKDLLKEKAK